METSLGKKLSRRIVPAGRHRGQALVGLLVAGVIMIGLYLVFFGPSHDKSGKPVKSIPKQSMERAKDVGGDNNLRQIGMCIEMLKSDGGQLPPDLPSLKAACKEIPSPMWVDPLDGRPYIYDPQSGRVYSASGAPPAGAAAPVAPAPGVPAAAPPPALPGVRGPGGIRMPDAPAQAPVDGDQ